METEKSLVRTSDVRLPKFVEDAYETIEGMKQFAGMLLDSKLVPDHFYEKGVDNKPDYTKGKVPAVVVVLLQAQQLQIPPMTALQHVIPVNGLLSIKGDLAKTMIFASGKLRKDSWREEVTGTIEAENMVVTITATRDDNGLTLTRTFSVDKAKRMGLWITSAQVSGTDGWKWKKSAWYKTPDRMLNYRALGNIARDLFSDVLLNMYTTEEAQDIGKETTEVIETESGAKITISDKEHSKARSTKMTDRVADKIPDNKFGKVAEDTQYTEIVDEPTPPPKTTLNDVLDAMKTPATEESPFIASKGSTEFLDGKEVVREDTPQPIQEAMTEGKLTLEEMEGMETPVLLKIINDDMDMMEGMQMIEGKNTNKKLRYIIFAHQNGTLAEYVASQLPKPEEVSQATPAEEVKTGDIPVNKMFDQQKSEPPVDNFLDPAPAIKETPNKGTGENKYGLTIPDFDKGEGREFGTTKQLFNALAGVTPSINSPRYLELGGKLGILAAFPDKEIFCRNATTKMINELLNIN